MKTIIYFGIIIIMLGCRQQKSQENSIDVNIIGERTEGSVDLLNERSKIIAVLKDNVLIETDSLSKGRKEICIQIRLTEKQERESKIEPNQELISLDGKIVGKTKDTVELFMVSNKEGYIFAYINANKLKKNSIPELVLKELVSEGQITLKELKPYLSSFNFEQNKNNTKFKEYFIYESTVVDVSARDRISLLFNDSEELIGIIHSRPLLIKNKRSYPLIRGHSFTSIANLKEEEIKKITSDRINLYSSSD